MTNNAVNLYFPEAEKDYRKDTSTEVWHFRSDCSRWPQSIYVLVRSDEGSRPRSVPAEDAPAAKLAEPEM